MLDDSTLEELADAARKAEALENVSPGWYARKAFQDYSTIDDMPDEDASFIAAASPDRVLALVREVQAHREVVQAVLDKAARIRDAKRLWCDFCNSTGYHAEHCAMAALERVAALREEAPK